MASNLAKTFRIIALYSLPWAVNRFALLLLYFLVDFFRPKKAFLIKWRQKTPFVTQ